MPPVTNLIAPFLLTQLHAKLLLLLRYNGGTAVLCPVPSAQFSVAAHPHTHTGEDREKAKSAEGAKFEIQRSREQRNKKKNQKKKSHHLLSYSSIPY